MSELGITPSQFSLKIEKLKEENKILKEAIEFYANENNWSHKGECEFTLDDLEDFTEVEYDHYGTAHEYLVAQIGGKMARMAIGKLSR